MYVCVCVCVYIGPTQFIHSQVLRVNPRIRGQPLLGERINTCVNPIYICIYIYMYIYIYVYIYIYIYIHMYINQVKG